MTRKIFLVFFFAFLIRLIALNQSLWLDEAVTANVVKNFNFMQIISKFSPNDFHPPLYYLFMKLWTNAFGYSEVALRMPSVLFSLATGYVVYLVGGVWACIFFLFNPLIVYYSQEARMYMMATFLLTAGLYFFLKNSSFVKTTEDKQKLKLKNLLLMNIFFSLAFLTFYGSIFLIATVFIYLLFKKQYKSFFVSCFLFLVSFMLISPLLYQQLNNSKIALRSVTNWSLVLGKANIKNLLLIPIKFSIGRISFYPKWLYWGIAGMWTGFVYYLLIQKLKIKSQNLKSKVKSLYFLLIIPLIFGFFVSFFTPMLQYFRFLYLIPILSVILSLALSNQPKHNLGGYVLVGGFVVFSLTYLLLPQFHREDWKSLVKNLPRNKPVYMIKASGDPVKYYDDKLIIKELRITDFGLKNEEITVIPYTADIYGLDYKKSLSQSGYQQKEVENFRELSFEIWGRR